jgi:tRNA A37 N6-isopentenylltransferase MiaA
LFDSRWDIENIYSPTAIVNGFNVHIELVKSASELEIQLLKLNPQEVILVEPVLEFMRAIEVFEATRQQMEQQFSEEQIPTEDNQLNVHSLFYDNSTEKFQYF